MRKVIFILLAIGLLATTGTAIAEAPPEINGWTYLGKAGCPEDPTWCGSSNCWTNQFHTYKKNGSENQFMIPTDPPKYYKMESSGHFKMSYQGKIWECEMGWRSDRSDSFYCHFIDSSGVDRYEQCFDKNISNEKDDFLRKSYIQMCQRNWGQTVNVCEEKALLFAYDARTYQPPNWNDVDQKSEQADKVLVEELNQENQQREEAQSTIQIPVPQTSENQSNDNKMKILEHRSGGCSIVITNKTVYDFDIKINGSYYGTIPSRKVAIIRDLNCDGFMAEAWPQGTVTGSVHRAFQHNQKQGDTFNWTLKYK